MGGIKAGLRLHQGVLGDGLHRGSQEDRHANADSAWRRRPDRAHRRGGDAVSKLVKGATLKVYPGFPHGMPTTNADQINADLLAFIQQRKLAAA